VPQRSALAVERSAEVAGAVDQLAVACLAALDEPAEYMAFDKASKAAQRFYYKDFVDLGDFCRQLLARSASQSIKTAAQAVLDALTGTERPAPALPAGQVTGLKFRKGSQEFGFTHASARAPGDIPL